MREQTLEPYAPSLIESMRAVGYSLEAAIADIVDNSISANAGTVRVRFSPYDTPYIAILDDGDGMNGKDLLTAMRHGSRSPADVRAPGDLGRFGLGLKTASLSQCRRLTVLSRQHGKSVAAQWDLDVIGRTKNWTVLLLDDSDMESMPHFSELAVLRSGTLVIWQNLDRLEVGAASLEEELRDGMGRVREHLRLVFHRFISPDDGHKKLLLSMNEEPLTACDPFLSTHPATERLPEERISVRSATSTVQVTVQPFILPHYSRLSESDLDLAGGEDGLRRLQGFYIYRGRRLIVWGSWFRLARQEELTKLARVRVDIPNSLDELWTLDIKKSAARPPAVVAKSLAQILPRIAHGSRRIYVHRGRVANSDNFVHMWNRIQERDGIRYEINDTHPVVAAVKNAVPDAEVHLFESMINTIEAFFPFDALYVDLASRPHSIDGAVPDEESLIDLACRLADACSTVEERRSLVASIRIMDPFIRYPETVEKIVARLAID